MRIENIAMCRVHRYSTTKYTAILQRKVNPRMNENTTTVTTTTINVGQVRTLGANILKAIPLDMPEGVAQGWIEDPEGLNRVLRSALMPPAEVRSADDLGHQIGEWKQFYAEHFGLEDTETLMRDSQVPPMKAGFGQLIVVQQGLTLNQVYAVCESKFKCWRYSDDLDASVTKNDRMPTKDYAIWIQNGRIEVDEELKNLSANDLTKKNIAGITLLERLLYELFYFWKTKKHLDIKNVTLCSGSRLSDGNVPRVDWHAGGREVYVFWYRPSDSVAGIRARAVVS